MASFGTTPTPGAPVGSQYAIAPNDCQLPQAGNDGISSLKWSPTANIIVSSNWDGGVRCWEVQEQGGQMRATPRAQGKFMWAFVFCDVGSIFV